MLAIPGFPTGTPVQIPAAPLLIQPTTNVPRKASENSPSIWVPSTHMGSPDGCPGSWFQCGPASAFEAIWGRTSSWKIILPLLFGVCVCDLNKSLKSKLIKPGDKKKTELYFCIVLGWSGQGIHVNRQMASAVAH